ncbi:Ribosome biogenesis protein bms1 [Babesia sp. Xinjiang]|uniref:Ribosome biogenesis protein bms1 n=1 Tax=Babesia sp. Xinjiang TaxID=462227 RepID=UPI000A26322E|nr:Ribosome biogenesis protein bms1 [Babesia sp. Xinjiang]ORM41851.1 Ribosome biogenesis protein bms1 [Babesia sp. Xinjiang]
MDAVFVDSSQRAHKRSNSRIKESKKKRKDLQRKGITEKQKRHNPKAFSFSGGRHAVHRRVQHASEVAEKRLRRPRIFKSAEVPPPFVVVVQGPSGVGKSTLIQSLVKHYAKRSVSDIKGPITLVSSKSRRITLIECGNSMSDMLDCCKVADLVLVMIDGSVGYELETLEFLNIMQTHGFPRVAAVVTHLESFPDNSTLRKAKKRLKSRFWSEIYDGAKMVYLNGLKYGRYKNTEVLNVARVIASQKPASISWRQTHFYCVCLRHEVLGPEPCTNDDAALLDSDKSVSNEGSETKVRAAFYGYVYGSRIVGHQAFHIPGAGDFIPESITNMQDPCPVQTEGRTLKDKNRNIYAPECDVGNVMLDDDAMYIELSRAKEHFTETPGEEPIHSESVKMVRELQKKDDALRSQLSSYKFRTLDNSDSPEELASDGNMDNVTGGFVDEYSSDSDSADSIVVSDNSVEDDTVDNYTDEIASRVYGTAPTVDADMYFVDYSRVEDDKFDDDWSAGGLCELRASCFQNYTDADADDGSGTVIDPSAPIDPENEKLVRLEESEQKRLYNEALSLSSLGNVGQFVRITVCGLPDSFLKNRVSNRGHPLIIGGLQPGEQLSGYMQLKLRKHRWAPRILKTNDPLLFSIGWRRFQSLPVYCMDERNNTRIKMLKYTPEHMHCLANIYGPLGSPGIGVVAVKDWSRVPHYRISATGVVVGTNQDFVIKKKLKVQGNPYKILKNTAFIKDMFTSELEVLKCVGSRVVTVSGIRGEIKKPVGKSGSFRATFEDKILMSDLVLLKAYVKVPTKRFFNPMVDCGSFRRVRTLCELRSGPVVKSDSVYEPKSLLSRPTRRFNPIKIPKHIVSSLPFSSRPKVYERDPAPLTIGNSVYERSVAALMQRLLTIRKSRLAKVKSSRDLHEAGLRLESAKRESASRERLKGLKKLRYMKRSKTESVKRAKLCLD